MTETARIALVALAILGGLVSKWLYDRKKRRKELSLNWATERALKQDDDAILEDVSGYWRSFRHTVPACHQVDDITWNDLSMDELFRSMDATVSVTGSECLYAALRYTAAGDGRIARRRELASAMGGDAALRERVQLALLKIRRSHFHGSHHFVQNPSIALPGYLPLFTFLRILLVCLIAGGFFLHILWAGAILTMAVNIMLCLRLSPHWVKEETALKHLMSVIRAGKALAKIQHQAVAGERRRLCELLQKLRPVERWSFLFFEGEAVGPEQLLGEYLKMFFFFDVMALGRIVKNLGANAPLLRELVQIVGEMDIALASAQFQSRMDTCCQPVFWQDKAVDARNLKHPLVKKCVGNDIRFDCSVLLTGSNASGKSTFMKAAAVAAIMAQTLGFCAADSFQMPRAQVISSMALRDDIQAGESYFIRELKSLRRLMEGVDASDRLTLCFIDEILRGTNTEERIASSSSLLAAMAQKPLLCMAATHDKELARMLDGVYRNMHFREEVENGRIVFTYVLHEGPATTRNAIRLLESMGFDRQVVEEAKRRAQRFDDTGKWS